MNDNVSEYSQRETLITVITVVYNGADHIEETIKSVLGQTYGNIEFIVIDGGSTDDTVNIINNYDESIDLWISEKDQGIYDAMNKGIEMASGEWINFMNAGDSFYNENVVKSVYHHLDENVDILIGDTIVVYDGEYSKLKKGEFKDFRFGLPFCHQSSFVRTSEIEKEKFDLSYNVYSDLVTYYKLFNKGLSYSHVDKCIAKFDYNGVSSQFDIKSELEKLKFGAKHFKLYPLQFGIYLLNKSLRALLKKILPNKIVRKIQVSK